MIQHLRAADRHPMPWKNGGGLTREVARDPLSEGDSYSWRVSIAEVAAEGPFSRFARYRRWISVIRGAGMQLEGAGRESKRLRPFEPYEFDGDSAAAGSLPAGPVSDLNLIFRPDKVQVSLRFVERPQRWQVAPEDTLILLNVGASSALLSTGEDSIELGDLDGIMVSAGGGLELLACERCAIMEIKLLPALTIDSVAAERRIRSRVLETPLMRSPWLSELSGGEVYLKLENQQTTGAFKLRGAANKLLSLDAEQARRGVVTASNGNHALAVATIGGELGIPTEVFVSEHIDPVRLNRIAAAGANVRRVQGDCLAAENIARSEGERSGRVYVSPYNDAEVIAGQGTISVELLRQQPELDAVFIAVGGGGLISGIGMHFKSTRSGTQIVGCWPKNSPALYECLRAGKIIDVAEQPTLSVSTAGGLEAGAITFELAQRVIDRSVLVDEDEILLALRGLYRHDHQLTEGAAGVAVAAFLKTADLYRGRRVAIVICGGNADAALAERIQA